MRFDEQARGVRFITLVAAGALLSACVPAPGPLRPATPQELFTAILSTPSASAAQARGSIQVRSPGGGYSGSVLVFYRAPDSLKVLVQAGFGATLVDLAITGPNGVAYLPLQRQAFELTPASALVVGEAALYPSLLVRLLGPVEAEHFGDSVGVTISGSRYYLTGRSASAVRTWEINGRTRQLESEGFLSGEEDVEWRRGFTVIRNRRVPNSISLRLRETTTVISLTKINVAPEWTGGQFTVRLPPDVQPVRPPEH